MEREIKRINIAYYIKFSIIFFVIGSILVVFSIPARDWFYITVGAMLILVALTFTFLLLFKDSLRFIKKYLQTNPNVRIEDIEKDFNNSQKFGQRVWVGQHWTIFMNPYGAPNIIENEKIVWAYMYSIRANGVSRAFLYTYDIDRKQRSIPVKRKYINALLKFYYESFGVVIGYNKEYENMLKLNFNQLLNLRYKPNNQ